jgi:ADP-sugar diphosphatase
MIFSWPVFREWVINIRKQFKMDFVVIQSVDKFGLKLGFVKVHGNVIDDEGTQLPAVALLRGGSVGILVVLNCEGQKYTLLTNQARVPIGGYTLEIPAGMLDANGDFTAVAAKELKEETGIEINKSQLTALSTYDEKRPGFFPSPGGCDEFIALYSYETTASPELIQKLQTRQTGVAEEGEKITLQVIPLNQLIHVTSDMKSLSVLYLYLNHKFDLTYMVLGGAKIHQHQRFQPEYVKMLRRLAKEYSDFRSSKNDMELTTYGEQVMSKMHDIKDLITQALEIP